MNDDHSCHTHSCQQGEPARLRETLSWLQKFALSDHRPLFTLHLPCSLLIFFCSGLSLLFLLQIPAVHTSFPRPTSSPALSWLQLFLPPPPHLLSERHLYTEGQIPQFEPHKLVCFSPGECFCCVPTEPGLFEVTGRQGLGGPCVVKMPHTSHVLSPPRKRLLLTNQDARQVCLLFSLMGFLSFHKVQQYCLLTFLALVQFHANG